jgi:hypothetical protein
MTTKLTVTRIPNMNTIVIRQLEGKDFFITSKDSIVIGIDSLAFILKFLVMNNLMSYKVLEGILEEKVG